MRKTSLFAVGFSTVCLLLVSLVAHQKAVAFTMTDRATLAIVRPYPKIDELEAEACPGIPTSAVIDDDQSLNGKSVLLDKKTLKPTLTWKRSFERSTYALWCVARSDEKPTGYREPMYLHLIVNGPDGEQRYRMRVNYMHKMHQDIAHLYFDVNKPGEYTLTLSLGHDSAFNLQVDRLELRDVLAGTYKKGFKTQPMVYVDPAPIDESIRPFPRDEAMSRAKDIAEAFAPRNTIKTSGGMDKENFYKEFSLSRANFAEPTAGRWTWQINDNIEKPWVFRGPIPRQRDELDNMFDGLDGGGGEDMTAGLKVDDKLKTKSFGVTPKGSSKINWAKASVTDKGEYTAADYHAFKKAPSRWPDDGGGFFIPKDDFNLDHNLYFNWMAGGFKHRMVSIRSRIEDLADEYYRLGNEQAAFRAAVLLAHWADHFPSLDHTVQGTMNTTWGVYPFNTFSGRTVGEFGKMDYSGWAGDNNIGTVHAYDKLFRYIKHNQLLADAVGQSISWVKTPDDVIELIDVKLLQHFYDVADRRQVRFGPGLRADPLIAIIQGNNEAGQHMLQQIIGTSDFEHPALLDTLVVRRSRDTTSFIGSMFYAKGPSMSAGLSVADITSFAREHQIPQFDLTVGERSVGTMKQAAQWLIEPFSAGVHVNGVGDVSGPDGTPYMTLADERGDARRLLLSAWRDTKDPRFAWMLEHVHGYPMTAAEAEREQVRKSAAMQKGDPRVGMPSRVLGGFGVTILENNRHAEDLRKRNAVVMRTGYGFGHGHGDQLNLEVFAKGLVALGEFGGRPGYGEPATTAPESHCLVTVDGQVSNYGKTTLLADIPASVSTEGIASHNRGGSTITRFVSMIDVGDGDMYLFDVVRATGGENRTYWFHANQTESVDPDNAAKMASATQADEFLDEFEKDLSRDSGESWKWNQHVFSHNLDKGKSQIKNDVYQAVWPLKKDTIESIFRRIEQRHKFPNDKVPFMYDPNAPKLFVRLALLGSKGRKVKEIIATSRQVGYRIPVVGVSEIKKKDEHSVFGALIEPFQGKAFLSGYKQLAVKGEADGSALAAQVKVRKTREDLLIASNGQQPITVDGFTSAKLQGKFGFVSYDKGKLRAASLVAGSLLENKDVRIALDSPYYEATIKSVDYLKRTIQLDQHWPVDLMKDVYVQVGRDQEMFRITHASAGEVGTVLHFQKSAMSYRSPLIAIIEGNSALGMLEPEHHHQFGYLTNEDHSKGWRLQRCGVGGPRWVGTGFRGGSRMGGPVDDTIVADFDGDGMRTLTLGKNDQWTEEMKIEVFKVFPEKRVVLFQHLNTPAGYAGSRSWAGSPMINERGDYISTIGIPGKTGQFQVEDGQTLTEADFPDADGDGVNKFQVYYFGPGDPVRLQKHAGVRQNSDGKWELVGNSAVIIRLPGQSEQKISPNYLTGEIAVIP